MEEKTAIMENEIDYIKIGSSLGGNQEWFQDRAMYNGGCAAVSACDICLYFALNRNISCLYPYQTSRITRQDYIAFSNKMKLYLHPRWQGIDTLELYISGITSYWNDMGASCLNAKEFAGTSSLEEAKIQIRRQINQGIPIPYLLLYHKSNALRDFEWHWFNLSGYQEFDSEFYVKAVTYGTSYWLNLKELWNTGHKRKGGMVLFSTRVALHIK